MRYVLTQIDSPRYKDKPPQYAVWDWERRAYLGSSPDKKKMQRLVTQLRKWEKQ